MIHFLRPYSSRCPISVLLRPHNIPNPLSLYKTKKNPLILELARRADGPAHLTLPKTRTASNGAFTARSRLSTHRASRTARAR